MVSPNLPTKENVLEAAQRLAGVVTRTPLLEFDVLNEKVGARVLIKPEIFQITGSFKFRGAWNRLCQLSRAQKENGVVAFSSGNHAQGIAGAAKRLGINAAIVMPKDAPSIKLERTKALGAEVILYDRYKQDREEISKTLARERGAVLVPSYDDPHIIAGQGTAALELFEDAQAQNIALAELLVPCGGGGLTAGSALARDALSPATEIKTVEPEDYDDHALSFAKGSRVAIDTGKHSLCDALLAPTPGLMTFAINQPRVAEGLVVSQSAVLDAMRFAFTELKLVIEPGGCVALAALLSQKKKPSAPVGLILSGGNVSPDLFARALQS